MWEYTDKVKDHFLHPRNVGEVENPDGVGEVGSMACGDALRLTFKLDENKKINDVRFKTFGCASAIASSSALTELIKGMTLEEAAKVTNKNIAEYLGGLPEAKMHCSVMGREALQAAIDFYKGIKPEQHKMLEGKVVCECFGVTEKEIKDAVKINHLTTIEEVTNYTKAGGGCGKCKDEIAKVIKEVFLEADTEAKKKDTPTPFDSLTNIQKINRLTEFLDKKIRPTLQKDGGDLELVDLDNNIVFLKLLGHCSGCIGAASTMKDFVEKKLNEEVSPKLKVQEMHNI
ncbi:MAG: Fe-S cluster assembly protein NifU [Deltaproteobacteria bacterium CG11_big_fil_rev_8_21_14_0_20_49_13]|nr:MAG: Fe-S cluster assembly protein NifU [Deltaproteobacteria bacterium CG11_big_fil_rev_8_21_14_0_20_49_13]